MTRGEELLAEDGWKFVRIDGGKYLYQKFGMFVYYNPSKDTFSNVFVGDPEISPKETDNKT